MRRLAIALLAIAALAYGATGLTVVAPGEAVVVRRFGAVLPEVWTAGPHLGLPYGLDRRDRVRTDAVRRLEIGLARPGIAGPEDDPAAGEFLTADRNLMRVRAVVQYRVDDPSAFALVARDAEGLLARLAESALARSLARTPIDEALRAGGADAAIAAETELRGAAKALGLGAAILGVRLTDARPPSEVQPDFDAAQAARSEADRRGNEARTEAARTEAAAKAEAAERVDRANAGADRAVALAEARAGRFLDLLPEARRDRERTVLRLYRDALRDLLPRVRRKVVAPEGPVDLGLYGVEP